MRELPKSAALNKFSRPVCAERKIILWSQRTAAFCAMLQKSHKIWSRGTEREKMGTANYLVGSVVYILIVLISDSKCVYFRKLSKNRITWGWWKMFWKDPVTIREAHLSLLHGGDRCRKRGIHSKRQAEGSWCRAGWHLKEDQNQPHNFFPL